MVGRGGALPLFFPFYSKSLGKPYLKILDLSKHIVADIPMNTKNKQKKFSFTPSQSKNESKNRP